VLTAFVHGTTGPRHLVHLWSLDAELPRSTSYDIRDRGMYEICASALHVVKAMARMAGSIADLSLVTRAARTVGAEVDTNPIQALGWGLARAIGAELPDVRCRRIDLPASNEDVGGALIDALLAESDAVELAWRADRWWTPRLTAMPAPTTDTHAVTLDVGGRGSFDRLRLVPFEPIAPGAGEVQIRVTASGLNFRDVLNTLGMYPGDAGPLGNECVGEISAVGPGVTGFAPGDAVVAVGGACFSTFVTTSAELVAKRPEKLSDVEAATVPIAFLTAEQALVQIARLQPGERVLIHAAAGGVGMAAVQIARRLGAEVYATAGSEEKRAYVMSLGAVHVADSRSVHFADDIRRVTGGRGVDVVLNSLTGPFITASLDLLAPGGRFVEIGKKGILEASAVADHRPDVSYSVLFLGDVIRQSPGEVGECLRGLLDRCARGDLETLPYRVFTFERAASAFRFMARAHHIGKVVLVPEHWPAWRVRSNGAYLVTGGAGAMGRHAVRWLAAQGARHIVLVGRSSSPDLAAIGTMPADTVVEFMTCDVADATAVQRLIATFGKNWPRLLGILHAAGALHDGMLVQQAWADFRAGLEAKVVGTWNLHAATRRLPLDFFLSYSSLAATVGSRGQAAYCAANAFVDAFASARRAEGLPALSIAWGAWAHGGMSARLSDANRRRWQDEGVAPLSERDGDAVLCQSATADTPHMIAARVDWESFSAGRPERRALLSRLIGSTPAQSFALEPIADKPTLGETLRRLAPADRRRTLVAHVRRQVARLVGLPDEHRIDEHTGFREVGLDSLTAVELRNALQAEAGIALPATLAFDLPTPATLADHLLVALGLDVSREPEAAVEPGVAAQAEERGDELSEEEAAALLERELDALGRAFGMD
jgi:NADPH:quinone reductase-like Zn-dependent oxidoreductase/acyl carrier protein